MIVDVPLQMASLKQSSANVPAELCMLQLSSSAYHRFQLKKCHAAEPEARLKASC